jgi:uncharacterized protein YdeI (YjbR/CyaY-like superfamily)
MDTYIAASDEFAKPILTRLRELVHRACPEVEETMKWGHPNFTHRGMMCVLAAFKGHCRFGFWKGDLIFGVGKDPGRPGRAVREQLRNITCLADLPPDEVLCDCIKQAAALNEAGVKSPGPKKRGRTKDLVVPEFFMVALRKNKKALVAFEAFSYSHKKEYVQWVAEAKREETRQKRMQTTLDWLAKGKSRNWKYE